MAAKTVFQVPLWDGYTGDRYPIEDATTGHPMPFVSKALG